MSLTDTFTGPARRFLEGRLRQLSSRLEQLGGLLRERIAAAIGQTVAETVREAVRAALADRDAPATSPPQREPDLAWDYPAGPTHNEGYDTAEFDGLGWESLPSPAPPAPPPLPSRPRWQQGLWLGLQAAAWWLRTRPCRRPVTTALGVGAAVGLAGALAGTTAAILVGCAGTALALVALADAARDAVGGLLGLARA